MKQFETFEYEEFEVISTSKKCFQCKFQCKVTVPDKKQINVSCRHPKGPGNPVHCIYFKQK